MNYLSIEPYYGIGIGIQAVTDMITEDNVEETSSGYHIKASLKVSGVLIYFLCFRILLGKAILIKY